MRLFEYGKNMLTTALSVVGFPMLKTTDLTGQKFGRLTVVKSLDYKRFPSGQRKMYWECLCDCGNISQVLGPSLIRGNSKSCGCLRVEVSGNLNLSHGHTKKYEQTPEYNSWCSVLARCTNESNDKFKDYGARGITVDDSWLVFENFLQDMGVKPDSSYTIERIDNNKGYNKENCKWATRREQANNRRSTKLVTYNGREDSLANWCSSLGIDYKHTWYIMSKGIPFEKAIYL